jgi:hypothetical protein
MSTDPFSAPAVSSDTKITEFAGDLLLITPTSYEEEVKTVHGEKDAVKANVVVIDEKRPERSDVHENLLIFQGRLIGQTKPFVGKGLVLGRLREAKELKKPGQSAPWILDDPTDEEKALAREYLASVAPSI